MPEYRHRRTGETKITVRGSTNDRRIAKSDDWELVDDTVGVTDDSQSNDEPRPSSSPTEDV